MRDDRPKMRSFRLFNGGPLAELGWAAVLLFAAPVALGAALAFFAWLYR